MPAMSSIALGPWAPDVLEPLGIKLPLAVKRGYHRHFRPQGNAALARPVLDAENGYVLAPMEQGIRLTTGVEFAARDAPPTPVQLERLMPAAQETCFRSASRSRRQPWTGRAAVLCRFPAGHRPRAGTAPGCGSPTATRHWGLTLGPATGRLHRRNDDRRDAVLRSAALCAERFAE